MSRVISRSMRPGEVTINLLTQKFKELFLRPMCQERRVTGSSAYAFLPLVDLCLVTELLNVFYADILSIHMYKLSGAIYMSQKCGGNLQGPAR